jgi:hypothetical protein
MAISQTGFFSGGGFASASSGTVPFSAGAGLSGFMLLFIGVESSTSTAINVSTLTDSGGVNTWEKYDSTHFTQTNDGSLTGNSSFGMEIWFCRSGTLTGSGTFNIGLSGTTDHCAAGGYIFSGVNTTHPFDLNSGLPIKTGVNGTAASLSASVTTNTANGLVFGCWGTASNTASTSAPTFGGAANDQNVSVNFSSGGSFWDKIFGPYKAYSGAALSSELVDWGSVKNHTAIVFALTSDAQTLGVSGTLSTTGTADTFAATGTFGFPFTTDFGDLHVTEAADVLAAVGTVAAVGTLSAFETPDIFSAFIKLPIVGTWASTEVTDKFSGTGIGLGEDGTMLVTEGVDRLTMIGVVPIAGSLTAVENPDRFRAIGAGVTSGHRRRRVVIIT